ncbi:DUF4352 domain-containing protein [Anaeromicropila populeti]|uniref:Uncharacterized protein n=1 Tax=Anaeromicropila populeti TaxID=37658 RepID=A0A1I6IK66_9FIRM|nr:DUF4352 domain-containing protein [Anaeromicropila populeti]SFR67112.1 protein of unknown function [Anaeromicropila populeti]
MKKKFFVGILLVSLITTGCSGKAEITDKENDQIAEYIAGSLLKYDKHYKEELIYTDDEESIAEEETVTVTPTPQPVSTSIAAETTEQTKEPEATENSTTEVLQTASLSQVIAQNKFEVKYSSYQLCNSYPDKETNTYFTLSPAEGNQLLIVSFQIKNVSKSRKTIDLMESKINYQLIVDGKVTKPSLTLLVNDLQYLKTEIEGGKDTDGILVFEVSKKLSVEGGSIKISNGKEEAVVAFK